jgi:hypothetical protein
MARAASPAGRDPVRLTSPLRGPARVRNSPADRVPSHGTTLLATAWAIDLVPVDARGRGGRFTLRSLLLPEPPERFVGYGAEVLAPLAGIVRRVHDLAEDHRARRGLPSIGYALTQRRRLRAGWEAVAGNHVVLEVLPTADGSGPPGTVHVALCHLRRGSVVVVPGQRVEAGDPLGRCGSSGNSIEPHVHLQAMDGPDPTRAEALPITFPGGLPRSGGNQPGRP